MGHEGCPSGGEVLLPLQQPQALYPQLPTTESLQREYTVKLQGGESVQEGTPQMKTTMPKNPQEEVPEV